MRLYYRRRLKTVYKDINNKKIEAELSTAWGWKKILGVNSKYWTVRTKSGRFWRTFYCTPDTIVRVKKKK